MGHPHSYDYDIPRWYDRDNLTIEAAQVIEVRRKRRIHPVLRVSLFSGVEPEKGAVFSLGRQGCRRCRIFHPSFWKNSFAVPYAVSEGKQAEAGPVPGSGKHVT